MNKKAFSFIEILMTMAILGILVTISIGLLKSRDYIQRSYIAKGQKIIRTFDLAMAQIRETEPTQCPLGKFIYKVGDKYYFGILNSTGTATASLDELITLFSDHIKFYDYPTVFCKYTKYCSDNSIKGGILTGDLHVGIKIFDNDDIKPGNCPAYYVPETGKKVTPSSDSVCWGKLYVDTEGGEKIDDYKGPDVEGKDIYVFGLGETGIVR